MSTTGHRKAEQEQSVKWGTQSSETGERGKRDRVGLKAVRARRRGE